MGLIQIPLIVLFSLPVALIGALLALALAGKNISVFVLIGMIMLMGLVAKNAILLVDFTNKFNSEVFLAFPVIAGQ